MILALTPRTIISIFCLFLQSYPFVYLQTFTRDSDFSIKKGLIDYQFIHLEVEK